MNRLILASSLLVIGCSSAAAPPEAMPGCNPVIGDDCLTPFPVELLTQTDDATTATTSA